jgi:Ca2+-binding RTX toxin-like protein
MAGVNEFLFNEQFYLAQNPDVAAAVRAGVFANGRAHWTMFGRAEGRPASPYYNDTVYAASNPDLAAAGLTTQAQRILHFTQFGVNEDRNFFSANLFNVRDYAASNPDLAGAGITSDAALLRHFKNFGINEGRSASNAFSATVYLQQNPDLNAAFGNGQAFGGLTGNAAATLHYYNFGILEGRAFPAAPAPTFTLESGGQTGLTSFAGAAGADVDVVVNAPAATTQVRVSFVSGDVGNGNTRTTDGDFAVRLQQEDGKDALTGPTLRTEDEGITFTAKNGQSFDVRDFVSGAQRGDQFRTVTLGTSGNDIYVAKDVHTYINAGGGNDAISGGKGNDFLVGGAGDDQLIVNGGGSDSVIGGGGNDTLAGLGNFKDYTVVDKDGVITLTNNVTKDVVTVQSADTAGVEFFQFQGEAAARSRADLIAPVFTLESGDQTGLTSFAGEAGADVDVVVNAPVATTQVRVSFVSGDVGNGDTKTTDGDFAARLQQEDGKDALIGAVIRTEDEGITFTAKNGQTFDVRDFVSGAQRGDQFKVVTLGTSGGDTYAAGDVHTYLNGGGGDDTLTGGIGNDFLVGGAGNDTLSVSGGGNDSVIGGGGTDTLVLTGNFKDYTITGQGTATLSLTNKLDSSVVTVQVASGTTAVENFQFADLTATLAQLSPPTFTVSASSASITEGSKLTVTLKASAPLLEGQTFTFSVSGDDRGGNVEKSSGSDFVRSSGSVTLNAGEESVTFTVDTVLDTASEALEGLKVSVLDAKLESVGSVAAVIIDNSQNAPQNFTLTSSADSITGGDANDTITGVVSSGSQTLNSGDQIVGGGGSDKLSISLSGTTNFDVNSVTLTDVETIEVSNFTGNTFTFDGSLANGVTSVRVLSGGVDATTKLTNLNALATIESLNNRTNVELVYAPGAVSGSSDTQSISLQNVGSSDPSDPAKITVDGVEVVNITSVGSSSSNVAILVVNAAEKINISGAGSLTLNKDDTAGVQNVTEVDASAFAGTLSITLNDGASNKLTGGSGNDTFILKGSDLSKVTVAGGSGTDTVTTSDTVVADSDLEQFTSVEALSGGGGSLEISLAKNAQAAGVATVTGTAGSDKITTVVGEYTSALRVNLGSDGNDTVTNSANVALTVSSNAAGVTAADAINGGTGADTLRLVADNNGTGANLSSLRGFESVTLAASSTTTHTIKVTVGSDDVVAANSTFVINGSALVSAGTVDASAVTGTAKLVSVTGGAGNDNVTGGGNADTLIGNAGNDTIDGGNGSDMLDGGAGEDSLTGGAGNDVLLGGAANDTLTSGTGNDSLLGGDGNDLLALGTSLDVNDTIDGGAGLDTLSVTGGNLTASTLVGVSNVEALKLEGSSSANLAAALSGITSIDTTAVGSQTVTLETGYNGAAIISVRATDVVNNTAHATISIDVGNAANLTAATSIVGGTGTDTILLVADGDATGAVLTGSSRIDQITVFDGGDGADAGKDVTIDLSGYATTSGRLTIDASALDAGAAAAAELLTIKAPPGATSVTVVVGNGGSNIALGSGNDIVTGGSGGDTITSGTGNDSLSGGDGDDRFVFSAASSLNTGAVLDTVAGGAGNDTLVLGVDIANSNVFANVSGVETLELGTGVDLTLNSNNGGFNLIKGDAASANMVTVDVGFTGPVTVDITGATVGDTIINKTASPLTVTANVADFAVSMQVQTITGSTGATDTLSLTASAGTAVLSSSTSIENVIINDAGDDSGLGANLTLGTNGTSAISINASALDAGEHLTVSGGSATNNVTVIGGSGDDSVLGGAGNDSFTGGAGVDTLSGGGGNDLLDGGAGSDSLVGAVGNDTATGGLGNDTISGGTGIDLLTGGDGADVFNFTASGSGTPVVVTSDSTSGAQDEITDFVSQTDRLVITLTTLSNADNKYNLNFAGAITGVSPLTKQFGEAAFVAATNQLGVDLNGDGNLDGTDLVFKLTGVTALNAVDFAYNLTAGTGKDSIIASAGDDTIDGGAENDTISGGNGNDGIIGGTGDDSITGGNGNDSITGNAGVDTIDGGAGNDTIDGGADGDSITAGSGVDSILGNTGDDTIVFASNLTSADTVNGDVGTDTLTYTDAVTDGTELDNVSGIETITLGAANTTITTVNGLVAMGTTLTVAFAVVGSNTLNFNGADEMDGTFSVTGGDGSDTLTGGMGDDTLSGGTGSDTLSGGMGADSITAGSGNDSVNGGAGTDTIVFAGNLTSADTVDGGMDGDTLSYTDDTMTTNELDNVTGVENITLGAAVTTIVLTTNLVVGTQGITINGTAATSLSLDASAETNGGFFNVLGSGGADSIVGGSGNDTISSGMGADTLSGGMGADDITGGAGADSLTGGDGSDDFIIGNTDSGLTVMTADSISGFTTAMDGLILGLDGDATMGTGNYVEAAMDVADFTAALAAANIALAALNGTSAATELYAFEFDAMNGYLFTDTDSDGDADQVIVLVGINNMEIAAGDIFAAARP